MFWLRFVIPRFSTVIPQRVDGHVAHGAIRFGQGAKLTSPVGTRKDDRILLACNSLLVWQAITITRI